jgi:hypothetical protein
MAMSGLPQPVRSGQGVGYSLAHTVKEETAVDEVAGRKEKERFGFVRQQRHRRGYSSLSAATRDGTTGGSGSSSMDLEAVVLHRLSYARTLGAGTAPGPASPSETARAATEWSLLRLLLSPSSDGSQSTSSSSPISPQTPSTMPSSGQEGGIEGGVRGRRLGRGPLEGYEYETAALSVRQGSDAGEDDSSGGAVTQRVDFARMTSSHCRRHSV